MISKIINFFLLEKESRDFINHNLKFFNKKSTKQNIKKNKKIILIEFNNWKPFHLANSYLCNSINIKNNFQVVAYESYRNLFPDNSVFQDLKWNIAKLLNLKIFSVYKSFGVDNFIKINYFDLIKRKAEKKFIKLIKNLKSKKDVENLIIDKIWIGDLFYDSYLKKFSCPSIDINSKNFKNYLKEFLYLFFFWQEYFKKNSVHAVLSSHGVYSFAIPLRILANKNKLAFVANEQKIYRYKKKNISIKKNNTGNFDESRYFKKIFSNFTISNKIRALKEGKEIAKKISIKRDKLFYLNNEKIMKSEKIDNKLLKKRNLRVLISSHAFTDSPHAYGNSLFPDFTEWLNFLSKIINKSNYEWFIKPHPNNDEISKKSVNDFLYKNKKVKLLNVNYNINHISKLKIDVVLTLFGVVAREYPLRNIQVINACKSNPHSFFNFSHTCKNINEYYKLLLNLKEFKSKINLNDLYLYHYMNNIYFNRNYLFENFDKNVSNAKGIKNFYRLNFYSKWLKNINNKKHHKIMRVIKNFIDSNDYALNLKHQLPQNKLLNITKKKAPLTNKIYKLVKKNKI